MSIVNFPNSTSRYNNRQIAKSDDTAFNTSSEKGVLKRTSAQVGRLSFDRDFKRPLKQIKFEINVNPADEVIVITNQYNNCQIVKSEDTAFDTSSKERVLKRTSSQVRRLSWDGDCKRPPKQIKCEINVKPADEIIVITNQWLTDKFKRVDILGRCLCDQSSMVFGVESFKTGEKSVIKITDVFPPFEVLSKIKAIWEKEESIHLTETVLLGKIQVRSGAYLQSEYTGGGFVVPPRSTQKKERWAYVYSMPLKAGDLKALKEKGLSVTEEATIEVVRVATEAFLYCQGIEPFDLKDINILTKPLTVEDFFRGKQILDYDYLKYTIESESYYLPVGKHLITLCDYDQWRPTQIKQNFTGVLEQGLKRAPHLLAEIEKFKIIPAQHCKILPMN